MFVGGGDGGVCGWVWILQIGVGACMLQPRLSPYSIFLAYFNFEVLFLSVCVFF